MPCRDNTHEHIWPREGLVEISQCEIFCGYCSGDAARIEYPWHWELRGHMRDVHRRGEGMNITVSPRPPKPYVAPTPAKRKISEVEQNDSENDEESEENEGGSSKDANHEDSSSKKKGKAKAETGSDTKAPSDTSAGNAEEDANGSPASLRLRAKPGGKTKKKSLKGHAASFNPVGPKPGPPSPKRARQMASIGPQAPWSMNNYFIPTGQQAAQMYQYQELYRQEMQDVAAVVGQNMNTNGQGFTGYSQQNPNSIHGSVGNMGMNTLTSAMDPPTNYLGAPTVNMGPHTNNMGYRMGSLGPPTGNLAPLTGSMGPPTRDNHFRASSLGPLGGSMGPPPTNTGLYTNNTSPHTSNMGPYNTSMGPSISNMHPSTGYTGPLANYRSASRPPTVAPNPNPSLLPSQMHGPVNMQRQSIPSRPPPPPAQTFYANHPNSIAPSTRNANHARIRDLTAHMLTSGMSELAVINHYNHEIEYLRELRLNRMIAASELQQRGLSGGMGGQGQHAAFQQMGAQQGGGMQGVMQQGGVHGPGQRVFPGPQQPGQGNFPVGQQGGLQHPAVQQPVPAPGSRGPVQSQMPR